jgi:hypothetical protein
MNGKCGLFRLAWAGKGNPHDLHWDEFGMGWELGATDW